MVQKRITRNTKARIVHQPVNRDKVQRENDITPSEGFKAAVQAALLLGVPALQIAQQYGLKVEQVRQWEVQFDITSPMKRRDDLSDALLIFVRQELLSLTAISVATMDEEWIKAQNASELALFISAKQDRLMDIFAAYGKTQESKRKIEEAIADED
jgi:hypothetical protein